MLAHFLILRIAWNDLPQLKTNCIIHCNNYSHNPYCNNPQFFIQKTVFDFGSCVQAENSQILTVPIVDLSRLPVRKQHPYEVVDYVFSSFVTSPLSQISQSSTELRNCDKTQRLQVISSTGVDPTTYNEVSRKAQQLLRMQILGNLQTGQLLKDCASV